MVILPLAAGAILFGPWIDDLLGWHGGRGFSGLERLLTQTHVLALYLKLFLFPVPSSMSLFHDTFPLTRQLDLATLLLILGYSFALIAALAIGKRAPWIAFGIVWFFVCHLLESTIIPLELVFEHRNYLATLGLSATVTAAAWSILQAARLQRLALPFAGMLLLILGLNTAARASVWGDLELLLRTEYAARPHSVRVLSELATFESKRGHQAAAIDYLNQLLALDIADAGPELGQGCGLTMM